jgi:hypothetical protein
MTDLQRRFYDHMWNMVPLLNTQLYGVLAKGSNTFIYPSLLGAATGQIYKLLDTLDKCE